MEDIKRTEWLEVGDIICDNIRTGNFYIVDTIKPNGIIAERVTITTEKREAIFISDADPTQWYRITNTNP